ncbi:MAG: hypothetical protein V7K98_04465 [Nostoc sp.]
MIKSCSHVTVGFCPSDRITSPNSSVVFAALSSDRFWVKALI